MLLPLVLLGGGIAGLLWVARRSSGGSGVDLSGALLALDGARVAFDDAGAAALQGAGDVAREAGEALSNAGQAIAGNLVLEAGETFTPPTAAFAARLAARVPFLQVYVTDGLRSARDQAGAMLAKAVKADAARAAGKAPAWSDDLTQLYTSSAELIARLLDSGRDLDTWTAIIEADIAAGHYVSPHLRIDENGTHAIDVRIKGLSGSQQSTLKGEVTALGARPLLESDHLHIDRIPATV